MAGAGPRYRVTWDPVLHRGRTFDNLTAARAFAKQVGGRVFPVRRKRQRH